jgi:hypothetical protein
MLTTLLVEVLEAGRLILSQADLSGRDRIKILRQASSCAFPKGESLGRAGQPDLEHYFPGNFYLYHHDLVPGISLSKRDRPSSCSHLCRHGFLLRDHGSGKETAQEVNFPWLYNDAGSGPAGQILTRASCEDYLPVSKEKRMA